MNLGDCWPKIVSLNAFRSFLSYSPTPSVFNFLMKFIPAGQSKRVETMRMIESVPIGFRFNQADNPNFQDDVDPLPLKVDGLSHENSDPLKL